MSKDKENTEHFLKLYKDHSDELFRYCFFKTGNRELAVEITQEVFTKMWSSTQKGNVLDNAKAFLYASARNSVTDWYRKKKMVSLDELDEAGFDSPYEPTHRPVDLLEVERILEKAGQLEEKYQEVIILRFVNDLSITEIALLLKEKENNISVRIHRALEKLRKLYTHEK
ncbi:MAG: sigma-70 family RNA polymerase sigma factor [Candidatus Paceibacterota bacterium]|jgi:RNA polymerase sigma-70 factor (ECF subfamily)